MDKILNPDFILHLKLQIASIEDRISDIRCCLPCQKLKYCQTCGTRFLNLREELFSIEENCQELMKCVEQLEK